MKITNVLIATLSLWTLTAAAAPMSDSTFFAAMKSKQPVCVKKGTEVLKMNDTYEDMGLKYRDCSDADAIKTNHKMKGFEVTFIKFEDLSLKIRQSILKELED